LGDVFGKVFSKLSENFQVSLSRGSGGLISGISFCAGIFPVISEVSKSLLFFVVHGSRVLVIDDNCLVVGDVGLEVAFSGDGVGSLGGQGGELFGPGVDSLFLGGGLVVFDFLDAGS